MALLGYKKLFSSLRAGPLPAAQPPLQRSAHPAVERPRPARPPTYRTPSNYFGNTFRDSIPHTNAAASGGSARRRGVRRASAAWPDQALLPAALACRHVAGISRRLNAVVVAPGFHNSAPNSSL